MRVENRGSGRLQDKEVVKDDLAESQDRGHGVARESLDVMVDGPQPGQRSAAGRNRGEYEEGETDTDTASDREACHGAFLEKGMCLVSMEGVREPGFRRRAREAGRQLRLHQDRRGLSHQSSAAPCRC